MAIKKYEKKPAAAQKTVRTKKTDGTATSSGSKKKTDKNKLIKNILYWCGVLVCIGVMVFSVAAVWLASYLVKVTENDDMWLNLNDIKLAYTTILYYEDPENPGTYLEYQRLRNDTENRVWVDLEDISPYVIDAFIAVEDKDFYEHKGVNITRTIAAAINEYTPIKLFSSKQGASTITQQLVKNLTDDMDSDGLGGAFRKIREIFRAFMLEKNYTKDIILEAYLNTLRLSGQLGGVQAGANAYFDKDISEVTLAEAATIAAVTKAPTYYSPIANPENNIERRNDILYFMLQQGKITQEEFDDAIDDELVIATSEETVASETVNSYFTDMVLDQVIEDLQTENGMTKSDATKLVYSGGLRIYTTVNPNVQNAMEKEFSDESGTFSKYAKEAKVKDKQTGEEKIITPQAAMVSVDYNGKIVGVVGGLGEKTADRSLNRAVDSVRPVGSTMKPIGAYALALDYGYIHYSLGIEDNWLEERKDDENDPNEEPRPWPQNYSRSYTETNIPVAKALAKSLNTVAVKTLSYLGVESSFSFLEDTLHISSLVSKEDNRQYNDENLGPLALGSLTYGISPLEMAAAYAIFGNEGVYTTPYCYTTVETASGEILLETEVTTVQAISEETAYIMNRMLRGTLRYSNPITNEAGTGYGLYTERMDSVGKTGTTSDNKDHWFIGLTPYYSTATWWGYDDQIELSVNYRTHPPTTSWRNVMNAAQKNLPIKSFPVAENVVTHDYCEDSGMLAGDGCPIRFQGYYTEDNMPGYCTMH
ncbi:MAG: penicillin-binding protein [Oscillospiraceae bacterium]|nr:penicillin-binding protein [Oscillospiraceae bacterium]